MVYLKEYLLSKFFLLLFIIPQQALPQSMKLEEAEKLVDKIYADGLLTKKGRSELFKFVKSEKSDIISYWEKIYKPRFVIQPLSENEGKTIDFVELDKFIQFFSLLESFQSETSRRSFLSRISDPEGLVDRIDSIRGEEWKANRPNNINIDRREISNISDQLTWWLETFKAYGLLNDKVYSEGKKYVESGELLSLTYGPREPLDYFFKYLTDRIYFNENIGKFIDEQKNIIDSLYGYGIIDEKGRKELLGSYDDDELKSSIDIIRYFNRSLVIDIKEYQYLQGDTKANYEKFISLIKEWFLPQLELDSLYRFIKEYEDKEYGGSYERHLLSIRLNGKEYWQEGGQIFPYVMNIDGKEIIDDTRNHDIDFINQYLADQNKSYRFVLFQDMHKTENDMRSLIAIVMLDVGQINKLNELNDRYFSDIRYIRPQNNGNNYDTLMSLFREFKLLGMAPDLSKEDMDTKIAEMRERGETDKKDVLLYLGIAIDLELYYDDYNNVKKSDFQITIERLSSISNNKFIPSSIEKGWGRYRRDISYPVSTGFLFNGKEYKISIMNREEDDVFWNEGGLIEFVNRALRDHDINGKFHKIENKSFSTLGKALFFTEEQYTYMKKNHPDIFVY